MSRADGDRRFGKVNTARLLLMKGASADIPDALGHKVDDICSVGALAVDGLDDCEAATPPLKQSGRYLSFLIAGEGGSRRAGAS